MATIAFDTLKRARKLEAAGYPREQASATAEALPETIGEVVVTREYLDQRLATLEANLKAHVADTRTDLLKWVVGLLLGQTAILAALVKLL